MANGEDGVRIAAKTGDAGKVATAYEAYKASMVRSGQKIETIDRILGK